MDRRRFVVSAVGLCLSVSAAGCSDDDNDEDEEERTAGNYRRIQTDSTDLRHRADALVREDGETFVTLRVENTGPDPTHAKITVQLLDSDESGIGTPYTRRRGPIESGAVISVRFALDEEPSDVAGYKLVIDEITPSGESTDRNR